MLRSITRSAIVVLALLALVGAGQGPTATADEVPEHLSRVARVEADHDEHGGPRCAEGHEREFQGETTCDHYCYDDVPGYGDDRWNKHRCEGDPEETKADKPEGEEPKGEKTKADEPKGDKPK